MALLGEDLSSLKIQTVLKGENCLFTLTQISQEKKINKDESLLQEKLANMFSCSFQIIRFTILLKEQEINIKQ